MRYCPSRWYGGFRSPPELNFGFIGSDEQNPNVLGLTIGQSASYQWQRLPIKSAFAGAQPNRPFYNQYVAVLVPLTDAYGFPYSDLVQKPLAGLNQIDTLEITVLSDWLSYPSFRRG